MPEYQERTYRRLVRPEGLVTFRVQVKETDLLLAADRDLTELARAAVLTERRFIEERIRREPRFLKSLEPLPQEPLAPAVVREMLAAGNISQVGPMAAVAGAIAERVGRVLLTVSPEVIVENGGDLFVATRREVKVSLLAPTARQALHLALLLPAQDQPLGVGTSSGRFGHSLSLGLADAATVLADSGALADALATALGNRVRTAADIQPALSWLSGRPGARGAVVVAAGRVGAWGRVELVEAGRD